MCRNTVLFVIVTVWFANFASSSQEILVTVKEGVLRGHHRVTRGGRTIKAFEGIPFAKAPINDLRFQAPVPIESWEGIKNATEIHTICPQRDIYRRSETIEGDEDCLYLNVYAPPQQNQNSLFPVMIFFHGGGWLCGGGNSMWYGPNILLDRDIILVVTNYRLGALGFLSTGDTTVPGNNGLKDQNLAMKWVQKNIQTFGGDPKSVTLFGESAGGASVQLHMMSPMSKGLFKASISQSGTAHCLWALAPNDQAIRHGQQLAKAFNCPIHSSHEMIECLKRIPAEELVAQDKIFMKWDTDPMIPFKPVIEPIHKNAFITQHPIDSLTSGDFNDVPWIIGLNTDDGALRAAGLFGNSDLLHEMENDFNRVIPISLLYDETSTKSSLITDKIRSYYLKDKKTTQVSKNAIVDLYTDSWFLNGADEAIRFYLKHSKYPVYYYVFGHRGIASFTEIFGDKHNDYGVCHADELQYLFPVGDGLFPDRPPTEADKKIAQILTTLWANFAKSGNPTPNTTDLLPNQWTPVNTENTMDYFLIESSSPPAMHQEGPLLERAKFWRSLPIHPRIPQIKDEL